MKLSLVYKDLCFKQIFKNTKGGCNSPCHLIVNTVNCKLYLPLTVPVSAGSRLCNVTGSQEGFYDI